MQKEIAKVLNKISKYSFIIGVVDSSKRKGKEGKGITNSELLMIHELGSPIRKVPKRPILDYTINHKYIQELLDELLEKSIYFLFQDNESEMKKEFEKTALRIESFVRKSLRRGDHNLTPLAPQTIKMKKSDLPLFDTGQLANSIVCKIKIKS